MVITVTCPSCSSSFPVDPAKIPEGGVNARCSTCGDIFRVEKPGATETLPTPEGSPSPAPSPESAPAPDPGPPIAETPAPEPALPAAEPPTPEPAEASAPAPPAPEAPLAPPSDPFAEPAPFEETTPDTSSGEAAGPAPDADPLPPPIPTEPDTDLGGFSIGDSPAPAESIASESEPAPTAPEVEALPEAEAFPPVAEAEVSGSGAEASAPAVKGFTFGKRDPKDKAKRLARVLVSDMIMYNAERHQTALAQGTLQQDFEDEIEKSWKEFVEQVGEDLANAEGRTYWKDALNDILAKGGEVF